MMRRSWMLVLIPLAVCTLTPACSNYSGTLQSNTGGIISFLAPSDARAGGGDFVLTVNGVGFDKTTVVRWNGQNRTTTFINSSQVTATITTADIAQPGTATVDTFTKTLATGTGYNGLSNTVVFTVSGGGNPVPTITNVTPNSAPANSSDLQITVTGTNFLQGSSGSGSSIVRWNATALVTTFVSATQLKAIVPSALLMTPGTATITVFNPAPGGGTSPNGLSFMITATAAAHTMTSVAGSSSTSAASAPAISGNGRLVAFTATTSSSERQDVFVQDTCAGATESCSAVTTLVSVAADGGDANDSSGAPAISADGRYIAFESVATNLLTTGATNLLTAGATNLVASATSGRQIFLRDTCFGGDASCVPSTILVSVDVEGALGANDNVSPSISASGRFVAFASIAANTSADTSANHPNAESATSANSTVANSTGTNSASIAADAKNARVEQVFVRDTCIGAAQCTPRTVRISMHNLKSALQKDSSSTSGADSQSGSRSTRPALAGDGRSVAISAPAANIFTHSTAVADSVFLALTNPDR